jgi:GrpB-like predicted nucleotidyltransferase (UPF0157 family)
MVGRPVELAAHEPVWALEARNRLDQIATILGDNLIESHHIGSTSLPGILAKPIIDLLPVVRSLAAVDSDQSRWLGAGYRWRGENGIAGRRFCTLDDLRTGRRLVHAHVFEHGAPEAERHLAFRDYLRCFPDEARAYEAEKLRAAALHPDDSLAYSEAKSEWIIACLQRALDWRGSGSSGLT